MERLFKLIPFTVDTTHQVLREIDILSVDLDDSCVVVIENACNRLVLHPSTLKKFLLDSFQCPPKILDIFRGYS